MRRLLALTTIIIFILAASPCWPEIPHLINYQGMLTDDAGQPLNGTYKLEFTIYNAPTGGIALWTESHLGIEVENGLFIVALGKFTSIPDSVFDEPQRYLGIKVDTHPELSPRIQLTSTGYSFRAEKSDTSDYSFQTLRADTADYALATSAVESDSDWTISGNDIYSAVSGSVGIGTSSPAEKLDVVGTAQMIGFKMSTGATAGHVLTSDGDGAGTWQAATADTDWTISGSDIYSGVSGNVGIGTTSPAQKLDVTGTAQMTGFKMPSGATAGHVLTSDGDGLGTWQTVGAGADIDWTLNITDTADTTLTTGGAWGIARYGNILYGNADSTHVNLGVTCTTGTSGQNNKYCTVGGGLHNAASDWYATSGGGVYNTASSYYATVGGGGSNTASEWHATVGGGEVNTASNEAATIAGGSYNTASQRYATVGGGQGNTASQRYATIGGGLSNSASDTAATVAGGKENQASGYYATIPGGYADTAAGEYSLAAGHKVRVASDADYTFAFGRDFTTSTANAVIFYHNTGSTDSTKVGINKTDPQYGIDLPNVDSNYGKGRAYAWTTYSSRRWKENINPIENALGKVLALRGVYFDWSESKNRDLGMIAEEVGEVVPEVVDYEENGIDAQSLNYARLTALLIEAIKEQQKEIESLNVKIEALEKGKR
ncbi:MAG: tail fiber domain-containing protein [Candidatus Zixiibacteriota bacterium]